MIEKREAETGQATTVGGLARQVRSAESEAPSAAPGAKEAASEACGAFIGRRGNCVLPPNHSGDHEPAREVAHDDGPVAVFDGFNLAGIADSCGFRCDPRATVAADWNRFAEAIWKRIPDMLAPPISLPPVEVGPLPHLADSLSQVTSEGEAQARQMCSDADICAAIRHGIQLHVDEAIRLRELINTPEIIDFVKAVQIEAVHQRERWGTQQDEGKTAADWFWLLGYLAGKALHSDKVGDDKKLLHHIITTAAACANWHAQVLGKCDMRPGIATPAGEPSAADLDAVAEEKKASEATAGER